MNTEVTGQRSIYHLVHWNAWIYYYLPTPWIEWNRMKWSTVEDSNAWLHELMSVTLCDPFLFNSHAHAPSRPLPADYAWGGLLFTVCHGIWWMSHDIKKSPTQAMQINTPWWFVQMKSHEMDKDKKPFAAKSISERFCSAYIFVTVSLLLCLAELPIQILINYSRSL